ncbi:MAG: T9SS type A sorting domain-containing protein [Bacteroidota bacterium]
MKYLSSILFLFSFSTSAQQLNINHTRFLGGSGGDNCYYSISTRDGGVLVVGGTTSVTAGGGDVPLGITDSSLNVYICKLDSNKNVSWVKVYGGTLNDIALSACQTNDGGYAVLATTISTDGDVVGLKGADDIWLIKIDSLGNKLWAKCYGSSQSDQAISIATTPDNGLILFGVTNGQDGDSYVHYGGSFSYDWLIIKTDSIGNKEWGKVIGSTNDESSIGSIFSANGSYYFASAAVTSDHDCIDSSWHPGVNTGSDYYLFKLDTSGNILWAHSYGGSHNEWAYNAFWDNRDSCILMVGSSASVDYFVSNFHGGGSDMCVMKTDRNGILKWAKCYGDYSDDLGISITKGHDSGYVILGTTIDGTNPPAPHINQQDAWAFDISKGGDERANKIFGSVKYESAGSVVSFKNMFLFSGFTDATVTPFTEGVCSPFHGEGDIFLTYMDYWPASILPIVLPSPKLHLSPNPTKGKVRIEFPISDNSSIISITDISGKEIFHQILEPHTDYLDINVKGWTKGSYVIRWQNIDGNKLQEKLVTY